MTVFQRWCQAVDSKPGQVVGMVALLFAFVGLLVVGGVQLSNREPSSSAEVAAHQQTASAIRAAKPGDLAITNGGWICVLGGPYPVVVKDEMVYLECGFGNPVGNNKWIGAAAELVAVVIPMSDPRYGRLAACYLRGRIVTVDGPSEARYLCGE